MKKITILALHLGYGGIEQYISSLCKMLENDYEIEIISTYKVLDKPAFYFSDKIKITYLIEDKPNKQEFKNSVKNFKILSIFKEGFKSFKILYLKYFKNKKAIKKISSDYVITTRIFHNKLVSKYLNKNIIKIATDHNYHDDNSKYIKSLMKSCENFDYFVAVSKALYNTYKNIFKCKCVYIPNVLDKLPSNKSNLKNKELISIGRLSSEKGFIDLISVLDIVKQDIKNIKLNLIGDGYQKDELTAKIKDLKLENNVILHGYKNNDEKEKYMLQSSLYIMTSFTESFGLVLLEAMSYGIPCIAFDSASGAKELINKNNGILIKNRDKSEMAKAIVYLLKNEKLRKKLGENAIKSCEKYLSDNIKKDWLRILR